MKTRWALASVFSWVVSTGVVLSWSVRGQIVSGQLDDFQNESTLNWRTGVRDPGPPTVSLNSGPNGAGDHALQLSSSGGSGAGSKLVVFNNSQWTGNWVNAGVSSIRMDVNNTGSTTLSLRLAFEDSSSQFASSSPITVSAGSGWQSVIFPIESAAFTRVFGLGTFAQTLSGVTELRLLHSTSPAWKGTSIAANLFVDNITAVPEGEQFGLIFGIGCAAFVLGRRKFSS